MKNHLLILFVLIISIQSCKESPKNGSTTTATKSLYEQILDRGSIRVGYISYPPSYVVNSDGSHAGIFHEVLEKAADNLGLKLEYVQEVTWDGMIQDVKDGKIDMVATGIWPTSQRGKHVDFAQPLFYSVVKAYTYSDNNKFDNNLNAINSQDVKIASIDGEMTSIIAEMDFPEATRIDVSQLTGVSQTLLEVSSKKADVTFVEPIIALEFLSKNPKSIKEVEGVKPLRVFPNSMLIPKGEEEFKSTLDIAIKELQNNGFVNQVISKYEKYPNSYYRVATPYSQN